MANEPLTLLLVAFAITVVGGLVYHFFIGSSRSSSHHHRLPSSRRGRRGRRGGRHERRPGAETIALNRGGDQATLIFLHGLGDTGSGWASGVEAFAPAWMKVLLPTAPVIPVTMNLEMPMPAWFDIFSLQFGGLEDEDGIDQACKDLAEMVADEIKAGTPPGRICIGGFSQGGAVALRTALCEGFLDQPVGGVVVLSGYMPGAMSFKAMTAGGASTGGKGVAGGGGDGKAEAVRPPAAATAAATATAAAPAETQVLLCHGVEDPMVRVQYNDMTVGLLRDSGALHDDRQLTVCRYEGLGHGSCAEELADVRSWIETTFG